MAKKGKRRSKRAGSTDSPQFELGFEFPEPSQAGMDATEVRGVVDDLTARISGVIQSELADVGRFARQFDVGILDDAKDVTTDINMSLVGLQDKIRQGVAGAVEVVATPLLGSIQRLECGLPLPPDWPPVGQPPPGVDPECLDQIFQSVMRGCMQRFGGDPDAEIPCQRCAWRAALIECNWKPAGDSPTVPPGQTPSDTGGETDGEPSPPTDETEPIPQPPRGPAGPRTPPPTDPGEPAPRDDRPPQDDGPIDRPGDPGREPGPGSPRPPEPGPRREPRRDPRELPEPRRPRREPDDGDEPPAPEPPPEPPQEPPPPPPAPPPQPQPPGPIPPDEHGQCPDGWLRMLDDDGNVVGCAPPLPPGGPQQQCPICCTVHVSDMCPSDRTAPPDEPPDCPAPDEGDWCVYWSSADRACYTIRCADPKRGDDDPLLAVAKSKRLAQEQAAGKCRALATRFDTSPEPVIWDVPHLFNQCEIDHYMSAGPLPGWQPSESAMSASSGLAVVGGLVKRMMTQVGIPEQIASVVDDTIVSATQQVDSVLEKAITEMGTLSACDPQEMVIPWGLRLGLGFLMQYASPEMSELMWPIRYASNATCPSIFPDAQQATEAFLAGTISPDIFRNWLEINNQCVQPWERVVQARRSRFGVGELIQLVRRECLSPSDASNELRGLGFIDPDDLRRFECLLPNVPSVGELIRYMVRDVEDEDIVDEFQLDAEFGDKFRGQVEKWARWQGVDRDVMLRSWRAHWVIPSPGQLFEMLHRLSRLPDDHPAKITRQQVVTALKQQDIPEFWIARFLETSHSILTRVDIRRAFEIGSLTRDDVVENYLKRGYTDVDANTLADFAEDQRQAKLRRSRVVGKYSRGDLPEAVMEQRLLNRGATQETIDRVKEDKKLSLDADLRRTCARNIRKRFLLGEMEPPEAITALIGFQFDLLDAEHLVAKWTCENESMGKEAPAAKLCQWLELQVITPAQFLDRLGRIGWSDVDAQRLLVDCGAKLGMKLQQQFVKDAKLRAQQAERDRKRAERERKAAQKREKDLAKMREKAAAARDKRERQLVVAAEKYKTQEGITLPDAMQEVRRVHTLIRNSYSLTPDETVQAVVLGVEKRPKKDPPSLEVRARRVAESLERALDPLPS